MAASSIAALVAIGDQSAASWSTEPEVGGAPGFEHITCTYSCLFATVLLLTRIHFIVS